MSDETIRFQRRVFLRVKRKLLAQRAGAPSVSIGLGMFGIIGWSVAAPTLVGALLGAWMDKRHSDSHSWTLALLMAGLVLGCVSAGYWISSQLSILDRKSDGTPESDGE